MGRGGMGAVFEAWDRQLQRRVAVKLLFAPGDEELALREARCLARVAHPNVVSVHDVGRCELDIGQAFAPVYIAMELVDGLDLRAWIRAQTRRWTDVLDCVLAAGRGLAAVHQAGLVHGDIKPSNVLIAEARVRIADFGLARVRPRHASEALVASVRAAAERVDAELGLAGGAPAAARAFTWSGDTRAGGGTLAYMAPECLAGAHTADLRADQYGLCAMAWELLFGVRPFAGTTPMVVLAAVSKGELERGRRPWGMPRRIDSVLRRGLHEDPERRWPGVEALVEALERARTRVRHAARLTPFVAAGLLAGAGLSAAGMRGAQLERTGSLMGAASVGEEPGLDEIIASIDRALAQLEAEEDSEASSAYFELIYARARLDYLAGRFVVRTRTQLADAEAYALLLDASVRAGQCRRGLATLDSLATPTHAEVAGARRLARFIHARMLLAGACPELDAKIRALGGSD